jgi:hypothetical protein
MWGRQEIVARAFVLPFANTVMGTLKLFT